jgi:ribosomal protein S18 acetylase RimI-like enzyme
MTEADLPAARQLWAETEGVELAEGDSAAELAGFLRRNPGTSHVACSGEQLVGAVLAGHDGRRGLLYHLAVSREQRGNGLGRMLVGRSVAALKAAGVVRGLILVSRDNAAGAQFWSKQGWETLIFAQPMGLDL